MNKENYKVEKVLKNIPLAISLFRSLYAIIDRIRLGKYLSVKLNRKTLFKIYDMGNTTRMRANTFSIKEPETIAWINSMKRGERFLDIGANVGIYSLYAATKNLQVLAVEPDPFNFALLNLNILYNNLTANIKAYGLALHNEKKLSLLNMSGVSWGGASSSFDQALDFQGKPYNPVYQVGVYGIQLDELISDTGFHVNHIKIDVDGNECLLLQGAKDTLANKSLKSLLIELDLNRPDYSECINMLTQAGFELEDRTVSEMFRNSVTSKTLNHIFRKKND